jgi:NAD(P)-dependent dehydrogenase (short-subunit alcohol dehydrogenase family)
VIDSEGEVALVRGAAGGIGASIAELFAECESSVVLSDVREQRGRETTEVTAVNLKREMGLQYATQGIRVNGICPGAFRSRLAGGACDDPDFLAATTEFAPMKRVAQASGIRGAAVFLASGASDYMTGQRLVLDGGVVAK